MSECLDILESLDRPDAAQLGMVERLKRLLGLKPQAARLKQAGRHGNAADHRHAVGRLRAHDAFA